MKTFIKYTTFLKTQYLKHLNTCKKHFETILPSLPLDECKIQGKYTVVYTFLHSNGHSDGCLQSESDHKWRSISINVNNTL